MSCPQAVTSHTSGVIIFVFDHRLMASVFLLCSFCSATRNPDPLEWPRVDWSQTLSSHYQHLVGQLSPLCSCPLKCVCLYVGEAVTEETVGWLQFERCLHAQLPCQGITAVWGKLQRDIEKEVLSCRHQSFKSGTLYPLLLAAHPFETTCCLSQVPTSTCRDSGTDFLLLLSISVKQTSFFFLTFPLLDVGTFHMCVWLYCFCECTPAKHFLLSDSAVIDLSSYWASESLRLAFLFLSHYMLTCFHIFHSTPHFSTCQMWQRLARRDKEMCMCVKGGDENDEDAISWQRATVCQQ